MKRRTFTIATAASSYLVVGLTPRTSEALTRDTTIQTAFRELEARAQGRLGVHVIDTQTGATHSHRADERFMMLSSFKLLASALVLARVDQGQESLARRVRYSKQDLISWSPVTEAHADGDGLTLAQLCEATITTSDNTAANLILDSYGGPQALTAFARELGDNVTRLDRNEPTLNVPTEAGILDTSTPRAMANTMQALLTSATLSTASCQRLHQWLMANTTGGKRLKAGLPNDWRIGDKTGTNKTDANDIGILLPPGRAPLLVTAYLAESAASNEVKEEILAGVGRLVASLVD